jgi:hypothetical protein
MEVGEEVEELAHLVATRVTLLLLVAILLAIAPSV